MRAEKLNKVMSGLDALIRHASRNHWFSGDLLTSASIMLGIENVKITEGTEEYIIREFEKWSEFHAVNNH